MLRRPFKTRMQFPQETEWRPLEGVARLARQSHALPSFHECEFMYMGAVWNTRSRLRIHLYKHRDTRRYLNLDDAGHAYDFWTPRRMTRTTTSRVAHIGCTGPWRTRSRTRSCERQESRIARKGRDDSIVTEHLRSLSFDVLPWL
jgi:hypothetical protein